jgi:hypothetical protein
MGVDDYRDREGDAEERTGVGQGERVDEVQQDAAISGYHDSEGDAEERTGLGSDPEGVDSPFRQATDDPDPSGG